MLMAIAGQTDSAHAGIIPSLRWWICGILFASTVINYIDRQTLSILAPYLKHDYHWTNVDYANIAIAFRIAYSLGQTVCGRLMDRVGTRRGLTISVTWYSIVSLLTSLANGISSFAVFRFLLGAGESANWPGASKAVSEWFPKRERGLAAAVYDSGSSVGGAVAPFLILPVYFRWGCRAAFVIPGMLGFLWLIAWRRLYHLPQDHPRISDAERNMILAETLEAQTAGEQLLRWRDLLKLPQTWGTIISKGLTDPVWFFVTDWFPIYLVAKGISLKSGLLAVWIPFFFFQAEDGIRDRTVTGVQTCALPISTVSPSGGSVTVDLTGSPGTLWLEWFSPESGEMVAGGETVGGATRAFKPPFSTGEAEIGRASCRERGWIWGVVVWMDWQGAVVR